MLARGCQERARTQMNAQPVPYVCATFKERTDVCMAPRLCLSTRVHNCVMQLRAERQHDVGVNGLPTHLSSTAHRRSGRCRRSALAHCMALLPIA